MTPEEKELREKIKLLETALKKQILTFTERVQMELYLQQWKKDLKAFKTKL